jgi:hypothetical protein
MVGELARQDEYGYSDLGIPIAPQIEPPAVTDLGQADLRKFAMGALAQQRDYQPTDATGSDLWGHQTAAGMITPQDIDKATGMALSFSGGGLATKMPTGRGLYTMGDVLAPSIVSRANPDPSDINAVLAAAREYGRKGWPTATREVFQTTPEAYGETTALVPQVSVKGQLPGPLPGEKLPLNERAAPIVQNTDEIANRIAERLDPMVRSGDERLKFYHTGPVIRGLENYGEMPIGDANLFMRNWSGQGAATSPRTQTPPNLRNSSFLSYLRESGNPLTPERYAAEGNTPGFPMMGMHVNLADLFARGAENPLINPKPFTFRENWSGNLRDVTGDTHNIRSTL